MRKIRKLVIPAAGWGTRFLPFTKAVHKELLPVLNKPTIQLLVEEARDAGIEEVILILSDRKTNIYDYFHPNTELRKLLKKQGKMDLYQEVENTTNLCKITTVTQSEQLGLGHAIATVEKATNGEPFAVILGDDLVYSDKVPAIKQLIEHFEKTQGSIFGVQKVENSQLSKYGVVRPIQPIVHEGRGFLISGAVEKPSIKEAPSNYAILGRYVLTPNIFKTLRDAKPGIGNEINLLDNLEELVKLEKVSAYEFEGIRYDLGSIEGFVMATIEYGLRDPKIGDKIKQGIQKLKI